MAVRDRLLGDPERLDADGLLRAMKHGSEALFVRAARAWGALPSAAGTAPEPLLRALTDARACVRRAAADALGALRGPADDALAAAARVERTAEGRLALCVARVRCGADRTSQLDALEAFDRRVLHTAGGAREPAAVAGGALLRERAELCLGAGGADASFEARARSVARSDGRTGRDAVLGLASTRDPRAWPVLQQQVHSSGRRGEHAILVALGYCGDPRAVPMLVDALRATDVDPGRGFAQRRLAAVALGRIGLPSSAPILLRALQDEALDYEGRPGAGLGIQYPVRSDLLWALGEIAAADSVDTLVSYLGNTHGSALGGFYLPAMDALARTGPSAAPALRRLAARGAEVPAANAVGVLAALREDVSGFLGDPRAPVRAVAHAASAGVEGWP